MPTREEKVAQLELALRQRFFQHIPQITRQDRANWTQDQHDVDRLSRALAAYTMVKICNLTDALAVSTITDGSNDEGIDAIYFDKVNLRLVVVQSKFKRNGATPSREEVLNTINGLRALLERRFDQFNELFQAKLDDIEEAFDTPGVSISIILCFLNNKNDMGPHARNDLNNFCTEQNNDHEVVSWDAEGVDTLHESLVSEQAPQSIDVTLQLEERGFIERPYKAYYGKVKASALATLVEQHGTLLFERNIRHYLGSVAVNQAIQETVIRHPEELFYLNNGITAVAQSITRSARGHNLRLSRLSIVNGAQTVGAILNAKAFGKISDDAYVLITIIELGENGDELGQKITRARNYQNTIRSSDFAALQPAQERLRRELKVIGVDYYYRPSGEAIVRRENALTLQEATIALACFTAVPLLSQQLHRRRNSVSAVQLVVVAKDEPARLSNPEDALYHQLFTEALAGIRMYRLVQVYRFIDSIVASSQQAEHGHYRRQNFFRHGRYFIAAFVGLRCKAVLDKPELELNNEEQTTLSRATNELAEMIYEIAESMRGDKGYLAFFKNQTDSQQLADRVLRRLRE